MSTTFFKKISIISRTKKQGFVLSFSSGVNIIYGDNDTGKSSLIKSLYYTLGGDLKLDDSWRNDKIVTKVDFTFKGKDYVFLREGKWITIFHVSDGIQLLSSSDKMAATASIISKIFNFNLQLVLKSTGGQALANPACLYLPFYIDQDLGWQKVLNSFTGLSMYDKWQESAVQYHSGLRPPEWYELLGEIKKVNLEIDRLNDKYNNILFAKEKISEKFGLVNFEVDVEDYKESLDEFLKKCQQLHAEEFEYRVSLMEVLSERDRISNEILSAKNWLAGIEENSEIDDLDPIEKYQVYDNKMSILDGLAKLYHEKSDLDARIESIHKQLNEAKLLSLELKKMMSEIKKELSINDIIESFANKKLKSTLGEQLLFLESEIGKQSIVLNNFGIRKKKLLDKKRTSKINDFFKKNLTSSQSRLDINNPVIAPIVQYSKITQSKTGSRAPRAIFCYHYSLLHTMSEHSTVPMLPIVIDSPKQQDLDRSETEKVISLCTDSLAKLSQVIIGASSLEANMHQFNKIELGKKFSLLKEEFYSDAYAEINSFLQLSLMDSV